MLADRVKVADKFILDRFHRYPSRRLRRRELHIRLLYLGT